MNLTRRAMILSALAAGTAGALDIAPAFAQDLPPVRMGVSFRTVNATVANLLIGERLGYAKADGIQLAHIGAGSIGAMLAGLDKGDFECCGVTISIMAPLLAKGELPPMVAVYEFTYPYKWDIAVKPDSPIKSYGDLRGKKIGVSNFGTTDLPVTKRVLSQLGINVEADVRWHAVGEGSTAGIALNTGVIDALAYFDTGFDLLENSGFAFRILPRPDSVPLIGGFMIGTRRDYLEKHRDRLIGYGRSIAKATEFTLANPIAAASVFLEMYPGMAPRGVSREEAVRLTVNSMKRRIKLYRPPYPDAKLGSMKDQEMRDEADFAGYKQLDVKTLYTNELIDEINNFDREKIIAEAKAYKT
jgi:NitT/TauT family transport system substrate-binding protein